MTTDTTTTTDTTRRSEESYWPDGLLPHVRAMRGADRLEALLGMIEGLPRYASERAEEEATARATFLARSVETALREVLNRVADVTEALEARVASLEGRPAPEAPTLDVGLLVEGLAARVSQEVARDLAARPRIKVIERNALGDMTAVVETVLPEDAA